jgi:iron complex transport system permease protein
VKPAFAWVVLLLAAVCLLSVFLGEYRMSPEAIIRAIFTHTAPRADRFIMASVRIPRILIGVLTGFSFGVSGVMLQSLLRNPLADAGVLGVNDGAGLLVTLFLVYLPAASGWLLPAVAFTGAVLAIVALMALTSKFAFQPLAVLLNGIGLSLGFYSLTKIVKTVGDWQRVQSAIDWLQGNLTGVSWPQLKILLPWFVPALAAALVTAKLLEVHELSDDSAIGLGARLGGERMLLLSIVAALSGSAISVTGPVYFVGFLSGNLAQRLLTGSKREMILLAGFIGAAIVALADLLARLLIAPRELRLFFLINVVGAPALAWLLISQNRIAKVAVARARAGRGE